MKDLRPANPRYESCPSNRRAAVVTGETVHRPTKILKEEFERVIQ